MLDANGNPMGDNKMPQIRINPDELEDIGCSGCGETIFMPVMKFKDVPALMVGQAGIVPVQTFICVECGTEFDPDADKK